MNLGDLILNIIVNIKDGDVKVNSLKSSLAGYSSVASQAQVSTVSLSGAFQNLGLRFEGVAAIVTSLKATFGDFINQFNQFQNSTLGLESISKFKGIDSSVAVETVKSLSNVKGGLISVGDASTGLKNLLSANFSLEQSVVLLNRLGDAAAFGRQGSLSLGDAIRSSTEGIKNGNSILVDNAGVTKNLSVMLQEAGFSAQDMIKASSDAGVRMAIFNGILKETAGQTGDAAKLMDTSQGSALKFEKSINDLKVQFGGLLMSLSPVVAPIGKIFEQLSTADSNVKTAALALTALGGAFVLLNGSIPNSVKAVTSLMALTIALPTPLRILAGAVALVVGVVWAYNAAMTAAAATTTAATGGINIALGLIAVGLVALTSTTLDFTNSNESLKSSLANTSSAVSKYSDSMDKANQLKELSARQTSLSTDEEIKFQNSLKDLAGLYPAIVAGVDSKTGALTLNAAALDDVIQKQRELAGIELTQKLEENTDAIEDAADGWFDSVSNVEKLRAETEEYQNTIDKLNDFLASNNEITGENIDKVSNASKQRDIFTQKLQEANNELIVNEDRNTSAMNTVSGLVGEYIKFDKIVPLLSSVEVSTGRNSDAVTFLKVAMGNLKAEGFAAINGINVGLVNHTGAFRVFAESWNEFTAAVASGNYAAVKQIYDKMMSAVTNLKIESDKINKKTEETAPTKKTSSRTGRTTTDKPEDPVDTQIKKWKDLIDVYDYVNKSLGMNEQAVILAIDNYISQNSLIDAQIVKLRKLQDELSKSNKEKSVRLPIDSDPEELRKQVQKDVEIMYDEWAKTALRKDADGSMVLKKNYNPFNYYDAFKEALELRKMQSGEELKIIDLLNINLAIQSEINRIIKDNAIDGSLDIVSLKAVQSLKESLAKNKSEIEEIQKLSRNAVLEAQKLSIGLVDNEFDKRRALLRLEHRQKMKDLDEQIEHARSESEKNALRQQQNALRSKKQKDLEEADKDEMNNFAARIDDMWSGGIRNVQTISRMFGAAGDKFAASFERALMLAQAIKAVFDTIALIKGIVSLFSAGTGGALPAFHTGGILPGSGDIPILAQGGEGIIRRDRMSFLSNTFGTGFFNWLNGSSPSSRSGIYHNGGIVSSPARFNQSIREVPYVASTDVSGPNLKLILTRQNKIDAKRSSIRSTS